MNQVAIDINRIEFVVTNSCSGKCKHCSVISGKTNHGSVNADAAVNVVRRLAGEFAVKSVMTFGGEPLLYAGTVCEIHAAARDCGVPSRQLITNGFFSRDEEKIEETARMLCASGVNEILISSDAFHQEFIPVEPVIRFAKSLLKHGAEALRVHPAWLVNSGHENAYNSETKRLLGLFEEIGIRASSGNNIFPAGNAQKYLSEYFPPPEKVDLSVPCGSMPYTGRIDEVNSVSITPDGSINLCSFAIGNVYRDDVLDVLGRYDPHGNPATRALLDSGAEGLLRYAEGLGISVDAGDCYSACGVCRKVMAALRS